MSIERYPTTGRRGSRARKTALLGLTALLIAACGKPSDPFTPGADVNADPNTVFATLMQRPDIDQATQQYQQLGTEIRQALSAAIPALTTWTVSGEISQSACGSDYPGIDFNGAERDLPDYVVPGNLPDDKYEQALSIIGSTAQKYGFTPTPQRLHDAPSSHGAPGSHDAVFHNVHDDGAIRFGTAKNTLIGIAIGCHLTADAKKRGTLPPTS